MLLHFISELRFVRAPSVPLRRQRGFAMFELVLAIMISTLLGIWAASAWMRQVDDAAAQATGVWLLGVKKAVDQMLRRQSDSLTGIAQARPGDFQFQDVWRPTVSELIQAGHLPKGFTLQPPLRYEVGIRVLTPVGDCHDQGCKIEALIYAQPVGVASEEATDLSRMGKILMALEGFGASVHPYRPAHLKGPQVDLSNPPLPDMPGLLPGSIIALGFYDSSLLARFVRQNDRRDTHLEAPLFVKDGVTAQGQIQAAGVSVKGRVSAGEYLQLQGQATEQTACEPEGLVARGGEGQLLVCTNGRWVGSGGRFGGVYTWHDMYGCLPEARDIQMVNPVTGWCNCPSGYQSLQISTWNRSNEPYDKIRSYICLR